MSSQIKKVRLAYFKTFWNILDIIVILIAFCCVIFNIFHTLGKLFTHVVLSSPSAV